MRRWGGILCWGAVLFLLGVEGATYSTLADCPRKRAICVPEDEPHEFLTQTGHGATLDATTTDMSGGGCIAQERNSGWWFFQVAVDGWLEFDVINLPGGTEDFDVMVWGPFPSFDVCGAALGAPVSCGSIRGPDPERVALPDTKVGQNYVMLVNHVTGVTPIRFRLIYTAASKGRMECGILSPVPLALPGYSVGTTPPAEQPFSVVIAPFVAGAQIKLSTSSVCTTTVAGPIAWSAEITLGFTVDAETLGVYVCLTSPLTGTFTPLAKAGQPETFTFNVGPSRLPTSNGSPDCGSKRPICIPPLGDIRRWMPGDGVGMVEDADISGSSFGCLESMGEVNSAWYFLRVVQPGDLNLRLLPKVTEPRDYDVIAWGPYVTASEGCGDRLTADKVVECSDRRGTEPEDMLIRNAPIGSYYVVMINDIVGSNIPFTVSQLGGDGRTTCALLGSVPTYRIGYTSSGEATAAVPGHEGPVEVLLINGLRYVHVPLAVTVELADATAETRVRLAVTQTCAAIVPGTIEVPWTSGHGVIIPPPTSSADISYVCLSRDGGATWLALPHSDGLSMEFPIVQPHAQYSGALRGGDPLWITFTGIDVLHATFFRITIGLVGTGITPCEQSSLGAGETLTAELSVDADSVTATLIPIKATTGYLCLQGGGSGQAWVPVPDSSGTDVVITVVDPPRYELLTLRPTAFDTLRVRILRGIPGPRAWVKFTSTDTCEGWTAGMLPLHMESSIIVDVFPVDGEATTHVCISDDDGVTWRSLENTANPTGDKWFVITPYTPHYTIDSVSRADEPLRITFTSTKPGPFVFARLAVDSSCTRAPFVGDVGWHSGTSVSLSPKVAQRHAILCASPNNGGYWRMMQREGAPVGSTFDVLPPALYRVTVNPGIDRPRASEVFHLQLLNIQPGEGGGPTTILLTADPRCTGDPIPGTQQIDWGGDPLAFLPTTTVTEVNVCYGRTGAPVRSLRREGYPGLDPTPFRVWDPPISYSIPDRARAGRPVAVRLLNAGPMAPTGDSRTVKLDGTPDCTGVLPTTEVIQWASLSDPSVLIFHPRQGFEVVFVCVTYVDGSGSTYVSIPASGSGIVVAPLVISPTPTYYLPIDGAIASLPLTIIINVMLPTDNTRLMLVPDQPHCDPMAAVEVVHWTHDLHVTFAPLPESVANHTLWPCLSDDNGATWEVLMYAGRTSGGVYVHSLPEDDPESYDGIEDPTCVAFVERNPSFNIILCPPQECGQPSGYFTPTYTGAMACVTGCDGDVLRCWRRACDWRPIV